MLNSAIIAKFQKELLICGNHFNRCEIAHPFHRHRDQLLSESRIGQQGNDPSRQGLLIGHRNQNSTFPVQKDF